MNDRIKQQYQRDTRLVYYDVTNYYFEIDEQDELRRKGVSKAVSYTHLATIHCNMSNRFIGLMQQHFFRLTDPDFR